METSWVKLVNILLGTLYGDLLATLATLRAVCGRCLDTLWGDVGMIETAEFKLSPAGRLILFTVSTWKKIELVLYFV